MRVQQAVIRASSKSRFSHTLRVSQANTRRSWFVYLFGCLPSFTDCAPSLPALCLFLCALVGSFLLFSLHYHVHSQMHAQLATTPTTTTTTTSTMPKFSHLSGPLTSPPSSLSSSTPLPSSAPVVPPLFDAITATLRRHPLHTIYTNTYTFSNTNNINNNNNNKKNDSNNSSLSLESVLVSLSKHPNCAVLQTPLFVTMASVQSDLYWQLIENFIYSLVKFEMVECAIMVCVSDAYCMQLCQQQHFPCFDFRHTDTQVTVMEQIAVLKLYHMPKALKQGVDLFMLDLDVGFLSNPRPIIDAFLLSKKDAYVQKDVTFIMNRSLVGWKTWYTEPLPNIGLFLIKGSDKSYKMFESAWRDYRLNTPDKIKGMPGKDQNKVVVAMRQARMTLNFEWDYIPGSQAVLLDKIFKFEDMSLELGGQAAASLLSKRRAVAAHTTCYEQRVKVMGLKAANAYWNPHYYHHERATLTKQLFYFKQDPARLLGEVRTLIYLAWRFNRTLIVPNLLAQDQDVQTHKDRSDKAQRPVYKQNTMWPGFRVVLLKQEKNARESPVQVDIAEPAFYWRMKRDYYANDPERVPAPLVLTFAHDATIMEIEQVIAAAISSNGSFHHEHDNNQRRLVLHMLPARHKALPKSSTQYRKLVQEQETWALDSVGAFAPGAFAKNQEDYSSLPNLKSGSPSSTIKEHKLFAAQVVQHVRLCANMLEKMRGNRSCFDKCD